MDSVKSDWENLSLDERMRYVVKRLVDRYEYPVNGAAGIVGNLSSESGVLPNRIEGSKAATPLRTQDFHGNSISFTAEQVMNRDKAAKRGPKLPGIGLAQWTSKGRRAGLFTHVYEGNSGPGVLFDMDAQIDYLDLELRNAFASVRGVVSGPSVTVNDASDEVLYNFEIPGAILDSNRKKLPRGHENVQSVFKARRTASNRALLAFSGESGGGTEISQGDEDMRYKFFKTNGFDDVFAVGPGKPFNPGSVAAAQELIDKGQVARADGTPVPPGTPFGTVIIVVSRQLLERMAGPVTTPS